MTFLIYFFAAMSLWDGFTTIIGTVEIIGNGNEQIIGAIILALGITAFLFGTMFIILSRRWSSKKSSRCLVVCCSNI
jgi:hypothetical protein